MIGFFARLARLAGFQARASVSEGGHPGDSSVASLFMMPSATGVNVTPSTALRCPPVAACIRLLSETIATVPLDFYERVEDASRIRRPDLQTAKVMERPNAWMTGVDFRRWLAQQSLRYGNGYARIVWGGNGQPRELHPLEAQRVTPFLTAEPGRLWYRYTPPVGPTATLDNEDVLHIRDSILSDDGYCGVSRIELNREVIGLAMAQIEYLARFFQNNAVPKGALEVPGTLNDETVEVVRDGWERRHKGLNNAHRVAILDRGMKFVEMGMNHADAQLIEGYRQSVADVAMAFGIPLHMLSVSGATSNWGTGIEQQSIGFIAYVVRPHYEAQEAALNHALQTASGVQKFYFEHNADGLLRGDFKSRMDGFALMIQWGLATPNEIRRLMNMRPLDGGDQRLQPLNMAPADLVKQVLLNDGVKSQRAIVELLADTTLENAYAAA